MASAASFTPALFEFLAQLAAHNDRDWFAAHREEYERHCKAPAMTFVQDVAPRLAAISRHFVADPRRSLFRIHRDTRFSADKSPYKTHVGIQLRHASGKDAHAPGFYVHLAPGDVFVGLGMWHPEPAIASVIREAIAADPKPWARASQGPKVRGVLEPWGESLKRPPRGFAADHPCLEDLKRKDFVLGRSLTERAAVRPGFLDAVIDCFERGAPYMAFLCHAVDAAF
jgi:uncharacterized protein (TIGR02453 family)